MKRENSTLIKKLKQYSLIASPMLAIAGTANSQVVYTDVDPDFVLVDSTAGDNLGPLLPLDLDNDGVADVEVIDWASLSLTNGSIINLAAARQYGSVNGVMGYTQNNFYYPSALNANKVIDSNGTFLILPSTSYFGTLNWFYPNGGGQGTFGQWPDSTDKYMGASFMGGDGSFHYGWVRMSVSENPPSITIRDFAYESTPNTGIKAGDQGNTAVTVINSAAHINMVSFEKQVFISVRNLTGDHMNIFVTDLTGKTILSNVSKDNNVTLNLNDLSDGLYLVTVNKGDETKTIKVSLR